MLTNHVNEDKSRGINEIANGTVFPCETGFDDRSRRSLDNIG